MLESCCSSCINISSTGWEDSQTLSKKNCVMYSCLILNRVLFETHVFKIIIFPGSENVEDLLLFGYEKVQQIWLRANKNISFINTWSQDYDFHIHKYWINDTSDLPVCHMFTTIKHPEIGLLFIFICYIFFKLHRSKLVAILILQNHSVWLHIYFFPYCSQHIHHSINQVYLLG